MSSHPDKSLAQAGTLCQDDPMSTPIVGRRLMVSTVDYHTAGEPFRIVSGGVPALQGKTILEKRRFALEHLDHIRQLLVFEPRGHADMYGGFVTEAENDGAQLGVVFFHNAGYSTACRHGTIAVVTCAVEADRDIAHPLQSELQGIYGVMFTMGNRNVTVFADGEVDRSPCGSGTSARLALLDRRGELARGTTLMHESVIGGRFASRVVAEDRVGGYPAVITEVEGSAHLTGYHQFVLEADDPIGTGFLIR